jgi:sulfoxide reductase heme-binding subunit YedZ
VILALTQAPSPLWYFARASGFVSLILLAVTVGLGLALTLRWRSDSWPTFISDGLHRYLATVFFVFLFIHVETLLLDPFTRFTLSDLLIPFVSTYRTFWMGLGICAAELALALALSVHIRRLIGYRAWRVMHYGTYATFPLVFAHGLGAGSDTRTWWGLAIYAVCGISVISLAAARFFGGRAETEAEANRRRAKVSRASAAARE